MSAESTQEPIAPVAAGTRLGPYEIVSRVGAGGMGEVFQARDTRLGRSVAIKILPAEFASNAQLRVRFEQEAKTISQLNHPHICTLYDVGEGYLAMELLEGETLRQRLDEGGLPVRKTVEYAMQIANGLAAAHDKGIIHRDLKPENIFITHDGRVKLLDFGLAKVEIKRQARDTEAPTQARLTDPGKVLGTVGYMSPEQVRGQEVDQRSDVFSFGAVLYEMLSGNRAFAGDSAADTMSAILKEDPPELAGSGLHVSPALDRITHRCLEKNREERFFSAHDIAFALEAVSGSGSASTTAQVDAIVGPVRSRRNLVVAGALGALLLIALAFVLGRSSSAPAPQSAATPIPVLTQMTFEEGVEWHPSLAPDGNMFVYSAESAPGNADIFLRRVGGENPINLTKDSPDVEIQPAFSPSGDQIAFARGNLAAGGIFVMGATGEARRRLTDFGFNPAWTPDGKQIVFTTESIFTPVARATYSTLWVVDVASGARREIKTGADAVQAACSPDGKRVAFWGLPPGTGKRTIYTAPLAGGTAVALNDDDFFNWNPSWSADGKHLYFSSTRGGPSNLFRVAIDPVTGGTAGPIEPVTTSGQATHNVSIGRDGSMIFMASGATSILQRYDLDLRAGRIGAPVKLLAGSRPFWEVEPSPDGQWLALKAFDTQEDLFIANADGSGLRRLTNDRFKDRELTWGPDGLHIYFFSDRSGRYEMWRVHRDGSDLEQLTRTTGETPGDPIISPDGRWLFATFTAFENPSQSWARYDLTKPIEQRQAECFPALPGGRGFNPSILSPDGQSLAGSALKDGSIEDGVWLFSLTTRTFRQLTSERVLANAWLADGTLLIRDVSRPALHRLDPVTGKKEPVGEVAWNVDRIAAARDGKHFYALQTVAHGDIWRMRASGTE